MRAYIDKQGYIYYVKKGQIKPHFAVWSETKRRWYYYRRINGKVKEVPFLKVHAAYLDGVEPYE